MTDPKEKPNSSTARDGRAKTEVDFAKDPLADKIGSSLRRMYDDVVNEPVPDDFLALLAKADKPGS